MAIPATAKLFLPTVLFAAFVCNQPVAAADRNDAGRETYKVWPVHIALTADEYAAMQPKNARGGFFGAPPKPADGRDVHRNTFGFDLPWATGGVSIGDQTFKGVGVRYKGNGTISDAVRTIKKSFKIDLDHFGDTGRFLGSKTINLHCGVADPSKYREAFGYGIYRAAGVPAPRTSFAEVRITVPGKFDNEYLGLYTLTEAVDKPFLRRVFGTDDGLLMKPEGVRDIEDWGENWERYKRQYAPKREATPDEIKRVLAFAKLVQKADDAAFRKEIAAFVDVDAYLRFLAATSFIANPDSFFMLGHNFHVYLHPKTHLFHFIPWDLDRAFSNLPVMGTNDQQMDLSLTHPYAGTQKLTERILAVPGVGEKYQTLCKDLSATAFSKDRLLKELDAADAAMKDPMARDAKAAAVRKEAPQTGFGFGKPPDLRTFVEKRTASAAAQLAGKSKGHVPTGGFGAGPFRLGDALAGPMMLSLDTDKDGKLSKDEWLVGAKRAYTESGKNTASVDQKALAAGLNGMFPQPPEGAPPPPPGFSLGEIMAGPIVTRADANKDGKVTADELAAAAGKAFDEFDTAKAGKLEPSVFGDMLTKLFPMPQFGPPPGARAPEPTKKP